MTPEQEIDWLKRQFPEVDAVDAGRRIASGVNYAKREVPGDFLQRCFPDKTKERFSDGLSAINETRLTGEEPDMVPFGVYDKLREDHEAIMRERRTLEIGFGLAIIGAISGWGALAFVLAVTR